MSRCINCDRAYQRRPNGANGYCQRCQRRLNQALAADRRRKARQCWRYRLYRVIHHKGHLVGVYEPSNGSKTYQSKALTIAKERVPKALLIDLDTYCKGYDRQQVKKMKKVVAQAYGL